MPQVTGAIRAGRGAIVHSRLKEGRLRLLRVLPVAARHRVAHDHDLPRLARRHGLAGPVVDDAQLGAAARAPDGQRHRVGQLLVANLAVRDGNRGLGGPVGVCHNGPRKALPQLCRGSVVQSLAAEQEQPQMWK